MKKKDGHAVIMEAQRKIIAELNGRKIGKTLRVLVDKKAEDNGQETGKNFVGRTNQDAPEIDSEVVITSHRNLAPGSFVNATINDAYEHDLYGTAN